MIRLRISGSAQDDRYVIVSKNKRQYENKKQALRCAQDDKRLGNVWRVSVLQTHRSKESENPLRPWRPLRF
jgi:hypothetical protein